MTHDTLYLDIETRSRIDLKKNSVYKYVECPDWNILMCGWALNDDPVKMVYSLEEIWEIPGLWDDSVEKVAHNAQFERINFSALAWGQHELEPGEYLTPGPWTDTMALAAEYGYPRGLDRLAKALGVEEKDSAGTRLINLFCKPNRKGGFTQPEEKPAEWQQFCDYGMQDVVTLREVHKALLAVLPDRPKGKAGFPTSKEYQVYLADQLINDRGFPVDLDLVQAAMATAEDNRMVDELEMMQLTGISNPGSNVQLLSWLQGQGVRMANLQAETVEKQLAKPQQPVVKRVLELRQELALVAAKKYEAAQLRTSPDGNLRGAFQFFGAHTGRWAGRGVQLQNLPSATLGGKDDSHEDVERAIALGVMDVKLGNGASAHTLKALVRNMFIGPFTVVDYSAIEARVVAWLAGEQWALDAFRAGRDIYVETAERMGNGMTRKDGKVAVLALGYNGGIGSLQAMGAEGSDQALQKLVTQWRLANTNIVDFWAEMDQAFRHGGQVGQFITVERDGKDRYIRLPSGRAIGYHDVRLEWKDTKFGRRQVLDFADYGKPQPNIRTGTYGGRLTENVTQAVARDLLAHALVELHFAGYQVVGHVHDEIIALGASPTSVAEMTKIMTSTPAWAKGLPVDGEGFTCARYRKG